MNPIHVTGTDEHDGVQSVDVRLYFPRDMSRADVLDEVSAALQDSSAGCHLVSAYELVADGFGHLTPTDEPLA